MRDFSYEISETIKKRWSPRAFSGEPVDEDDLMALFEAARYAPSCFNEQPWRFIVATTEDEIQVMRSLLNESNQEWANKAPVLALLVAKKSFAKDGQPNNWHAFDAGTAWGFLALEAERRGLITHAMGGFSKVKAHELLAIPGKYEVLAMIAIGKMGKKEELPPALQEREEPAMRKPLKEIVFPGHLRV